MSLLETYKLHLTSPVAEHLAADASIHYIPTLTSVNGSAAIIKHYNAQARQLKKQGEKIVSVVEGLRSLSIETETILQFETGGGTYLPGLDDNFLADKTVTLPIIHIIQFTDDDKIKQVRLYWDQGSLLKSVDVIGPRSSSWPLNGGNEQIKLVNSSASAVPTYEKSTSESQDARVGRTRSRFGANGDKYASLSLFEPRKHEEVEEDARHAFSPPPRSSAKPPPREWGELFASSEDPSARPSSPTKNVENPLKGGAGKYYHENRLFDPEKDKDGPKSPEKSVKTNPLKYEHFEFGEAPPPVSKPASRSSKHASQWDFSDFVTPLRPKPKNLPEQNQRHFGWSDDEEEAAKPTVQRVHKPKPRPDSVAQFEITDEPSQAEEPSARPRSGHDPQGLYKSHIVGDGEQLTTEPGAGEKQPLGNITNMQQHMKNFGTQIVLADDSSADKDPFKKQTGSRDENAPAKISENRQKVVKTFQTSWNMYDEPPAAEKPRGIKIAGDGAGSRKTGGSNWWDFESK